MKYIDTSQALKKAKEAGVEVTLVTLIKWCKPFPSGYAIGKKIGGRWKVEPIKLKLVLEGKQWVLQERNRREEREHQEHQENLKNQE